MPIMPGELCSRSHLAKEGTSRHTTVTGRAIHVAVPPIHVILGGELLQLCVLMTISTITRYRDTTKFATEPDILVQSRRNKKAAKKFFRKLLKGLQDVPRVVSTDKLKSYGAAKREILPGVEHRQSRYLNNRCENSHRPTRQREYRMQGFKSAGHAQRFLSAYGPIAQHFRPRRHLLSASAYRHEMRQRFASWAEITGTERAA